MQWPSITGGYLAVLALIYAALAANVVRLRNTSRAAFGDGGNPSLRNAIRAHGHFAEYVPIITLMVAFLEMAELSALRVHVFMAALVISRLLHPVGMYAKPGTLGFRIGRVGGMILTVVLLVACAITLLSRIWHGT